MLLSLFQMRLIITEKNNSAKRISEILSTKGKPKQEKSYGIPHYSWEDDAGEHMVIGLKGHVMNPAFPERYSEWRKVDPKELIDAELVKEPTQKNIVKALRKQARGAESIVIATDYDREGELIGLEALNEALDANPKTSAQVKRARFSALTKQEIERAFANLDELSKPLARAGETRQEIDLIWGATLTRFVSLATGRLGRQFLSVGRVQSPTLAIVVERELERRAHVPKPYWELYAEFDHPDGAFVAHHAADRFWEESEAESARERTASPGAVEKVEAKLKRRNPPTPFNTTAFTSAAASVGVSPARAMRVAENLYMDGFVSYPRTDNTVYPKSLRLRELLRAIARVPAFSEAESLAERAELRPTRGRKQTTDHPPIYPTQAVDPGMLGDADQRKIYELIVRRFLATLSDPAVSESTRADIRAGEESYFVRGVRLVEPGFLTVYPYVRRKDEEIPKLSEGMKLALTRDPWLEHKETLPPSRIGQGKLIEMMEERGLGTKATRHAIIQNLYDRGYIHGNPIEPTETGVSMAKALTEHAERIATPGMTAELEADMDAIAGGDRTKEEVLCHSRELLHAAYKALEDHKEELANTIWEGMNADRILGPCQRCAAAGRTGEGGSPNMLRIIRARKSGKRFVGCQGYPECDQTYPIPQRGELIGLEDVCTVCGEAPRLKVVGGRRPWNLCLNDNCPSMAEMKERRAARKAKKEAKGKAVSDGKKPAKRAAGRDGGSKSKGGGKAKTVAGKAKTVAGKANADAEQAEPDAGKAEAGAEKDDAVAEEANADTGKADTGSGAADVDTGQETAAR